MLAPSPSPPLRLRRAGAAIPRGAVPRDRAHDQPERRPVAVPPLRCGRHQGERSRPGRPSRLTCAPCLCPERVWVGTRQSDQKHAHNAHSSWVARSLSRPVGCSRPPTPSFRWIGRRLFAKLIRLRRLRPSRLFRLLTFSPPSLPPQTPPPRMRTSFRRWSSSGSSLR